MFRKIRNLEKQMLNVQKDIEALKQENEAVKLELFEVKNPPKYKCGDWVEVFILGKAIVINSKVNKNFVGWDSIGYDFKRDYTLVFIDSKTTRTIYEHDIMGIADSSPEAKSTTVTDYKPKVDKAPKKNKQKAKDVLTAE